MNTTSRINFDERTLTALPIPSDSTPTVYRDSVQPSLVLRVYNTGAKVFYFRGRVNGRMYNRKIGSFKPLTVPNARELIRVEMINLLKGEDRVEKRREEAAQERQERRESETVGNAITEFIKTREIGKRTKDDYLGLLENELAPYANEQIKSLTKETAREWHKEIAAAISKRRNGKVSGGNRANKAIRLLRSVCASRGLKNPCAEIKGKPFPWFKEQPREPRLEPCHANAFWKSLGAAGTTERSTYFATLLLTGMRSGEASSLRVGDVDLVEAVITLRDTKNGSNHKLYISSQLETLLRPLVEGRNPTHRVFQNCDHIAQQLHKVCETAGIPMVSNHDLRKGFALVANESGVSFAVIQKMLNHKSGSVTLMHYLNATPTMLRKAFQQVSDYICNDV